MKTINVPDHVISKLDRKLHTQPNHPIEIIKKHIYKYFEKLPYQFQFFDNLDPIVTVEDNFDKLLIPLDHPARSKSDTYYIDDLHVLRTHTSAHQNSLLANGISSFIVSGDVYRKDEIDACHYPIFHQMEIFTLVETDPEAALKEMLHGLITYLFGDCKYKLNPDYFPFTNPSFEIEVEYNGKFMEVLGCGIVEKAILESNGYVGKQAIACGLGLDRLAMIFSEIPDIRYLWSTHERFLGQYADGIITKFVPYSTLPNITKDISFYVDNSQVMINQDNTFNWLGENDFLEKLRDINEIARVENIDSYHNIKLNKYSRTYRITYSPTDPTVNNMAVFNDFVNAAQNNLSKKIVLEMGIVLR